MPHLGCGAFQAAIINAFKLNYSGDYYGNCKISQQFIDNQLVCPAGVLRTEFVSDERSGLYVEVRRASNGYGTYYLRYKDSNGKSCHQKIGRT